MTEASTRDQLRTSTTSMSEVWNEAIQTLSTADRKLGRLIESIGPCLLERRGYASTFEAVGQAIMYQQLTGKAAATIVGRVKNTVGGGAFPTPAAVLDVSDEVLRAAGLSRAKTAALKDLASKTVSGIVPAWADLDALTDDEIVERLVVVRGVGRWTAEMLLIFGLGRNDVLPVHDYGVRKGFANAFALKELPTIEELTRRGKRWRPYRSVASWYLWRAAERK